jgi:hypothetical protein
VECRHVDVSWIDVGVGVDVDSEEMVLVVEDLCVWLSSSSLGRRAS